MSGDFSVDTNVFKVDTTNNRVGINTSSPTVAFEVIGAASISGQLTLGSGLTVAGNIGIGTTLTPNQLTVIGSGSFTGQLKATRNPTLAHTGTWPSFTNFNDSTLYINPSSPVADGNIIAYVSGASPKFIVDAEGDIYGNNLILTGSTTTATQTVGDLTVEGTTQLGDAVGDKIYFVGTILPKTLTSFPLLLKASASQTVDIFRIKDANDNTLLTLDQGTGLLTASSGFNFAGGSTASTSYSRLGIGTTTHAGTINTFDDLLISGGFEVNGSSAFDGFALFTSNASISGAFTLGNNSATGAIDTSDWDITSTGNMTGIGAFTSDGILLVNNRAEFQGTASASYFLTGNTLQVGGFASAAYSRFGTSTTGHSNYISTSNDLLISGDLEVDGSISAQFASVSQMFISNNTASASYFLTGNTLQVGGFSSQSYSRFGTATANHGLSATNDLLISGKLEVDGSAYFDGTTNFVGIASSSLFYAQPGTAASPSFSFAIDQDTGMFRRAINALGFSTLGVERLTIDSSGNVGIGTTGPTSLLDIRSTGDNPNATIFTSETPTGSSIGGELQLGFIGGTTKYALAGDIPGILFFRADANDAGYGAGEISSVITTGGNIGRSSTVADLVFWTKPSGNTGVTEKMRITGAGNVGIGTTVPLSQLHITHAGVADGQGLRITNSTSPQSWELNTGWVGNNNSFFTINNITAGTVPFVINTNGNITMANYAAGACCSDIAEFYPSSEPVEAADVMAVDPNATTTTLRKARADDTLIGVVSTNPAIAIEDQHLVIAGGTENYVINPVKPVVALVGRVPVKISEENGIIQMGDRLTASATIPGFAMKQTNAGQSIGIALENSNGQDKVLTFVNLSYQAMGEDLGLKLDAISGTITPLVGSASESFVTAFFNNLFSKITTWLADAGNGITDIFAKKATLEQICLKDSIGTSCYTRAQLDALTTGSGGALPTPTPTPTPEITPTPDITPEATPTPIPDSTQTPEPTPEETPTP